MITYEKTYEYSKERGAYNYDFYYRVREGLPQINQEPGFCHVPMNTKNPIDYENVHQSELIISIALGLLGYDFKTFEFERLSREPELKKQLGDLVDLSNIAEDPHFNESVFDS